MPPPVDVSKLSEIDRRLFEIEGHLFDVKRRMVAVDMALHTISCQQIVDTLVFEKSNSNYQILQIRIESLSE